MKMNSVLERTVRLMAGALGVGLALAQMPLLADGVTRTVEPVAGGCAITLAWAFSGKVESDLVIEERYANGWSVDGATVPFASLDATWFSGSVARFAVKPSLLSKPGSITFTVTAEESAVSGIANGSWMMYLDGVRKTAAVQADGVQVLNAGSRTQGGSAGDAASGGTNAETAVVISAFRMVDGGCELSYSVTKAGTLVVEGCKSLGHGWSELKRLAASSGKGDVALTSDEVGGCCFMRMKLVTEEK